MAELRIPPIRQNPLTRLMRPLAISASGLTAHHRRVETIAQNIANAETTSTPEGGPYQRQVAQMSTTAGGGVRVEGVTRDARPGPLVYDPGHPDADERGYVRYPNVDITSEVADMIVARRTFEANASVFQAAKAILRRSLDI